MSVKITVTDAAQCQGEPMKPLTKSQVRAAAETKLEKAVAKWVCKYAERGYDGIEQAFRDLFHGGCSAGTVSHLIYYHDTVPFYEKHQADIWALACGEAEAQGESVFKHLADCRHNDPGDYDTVANFLAWYGFETAARHLADRLGYEG